MAIENFSYKKSLGQNFIYDCDFLRSVVRELHIKPTDYIIEIGAGAGTLTRALAETGAAVKTVEIDERLKPRLTAEFVETKNVEIVFGDVMEIDFSAEPAFRIVANVPYYITTPIIMRFFNLDNCVDINVLVAAEVADRIVACPNTREYGALSVTAQTYGKCEIIRTVPRTLFVPQPKIDSAFVKITKYRGVDCDKKLLERLLKGLFALRRKTILNGLSAALNLQKAQTTEILKRCVIDPNARPETLPPSKFVELCQNIPKYSK
jgi:16S rRNA (adenine1518-N6/adenine1519-N6)-dimethyltransferase